MIVSFVNLKGGVGKTTTAVSLAAAFGREGLSTLLVDLDAQGSAGTALGVPPGDVRHGLGGVLADGGRIEGIVRPTGQKGVSLAPADDRLATLDLAVARRRSPAAGLRDALAPVRESFDVVLIDCPPGLSIVATMGLAASDAYLVPTTAQSLAVEALRRLTIGVDRLRADPGHGAVLLGILLTMVDRRVRLTDEIVKEVRWRHGRDVFLTEVPINAKVAEASKHGRSILDYESWSTGGQAYSKLAGEVLRRMRKLGLL